MSGALAGLAAGVAGCRGESESADSTSTRSTRRDIPLRVGWAGAFQEFDLVRRTWSTVSSLPLEIRAVDVNRAGAGGYQQDLLDIAGRTDVLVYPVSAVAALFAEDQIVPLSGDSQSDAGDDFLANGNSGGSLLTALRNSVAEYAGEVVANPLGGWQAALFSIEPVDDVKTWADYDRWVQALKGQAAEPLAGGWAGMMFLWRAASSLERGWLFERDGLDPLFATPSYSAVLEQMKQTASRYKAGRVSPEQLWDKLQGGELAGGIGFPASGDSADGSVLWRDPPRDLPSRRILVDPFSPVASLPVGCRQSASAKQFIRWLSNGAGTETLRNHVSGMSVTRRTLTSQADSAAAPNDAYQEWLSNYLGSANTLPTLQLLRAGDYYAALDTAVVKCLDGEQSADDALKEVDRRWRDLNRLIGINRQQRAWRRAQGMLG